MYTMITYLEGHKAEREDLQISVRRFQLNLELVSEAMVRIAKGKGLCLLKATMA